MCGRAFSEHDLHRDARTGAGRSLLGWLRGLWRPRQPQVEAAEVLPLPVPASRAGQEAERTDAKAA
jgi:hypothetical protein